MAQEIERKFLVRDDSWRQASDGGTAISQGYLGSRPECAVRVRIKGDTAWLTIKGATRGISRSEYEYLIPLADARAMLEELAVRPFIDKVRHEIAFGAHVWVTAIACVWVFNCT